MKRWILVFLLIPPTALAYEITPEAIERHIAYLAGDALEGRDSGTEGGKRAEEYVAGELRAAGLEGVEFQSFEFLAGARLGTDNLIEIDGRPLPRGSFQPYPFSASGSGEWKTVFAGYGIAAKELGRDDYAGLEVKGKAVVVLAGTPGEDGPHGKFAAHGMARAKVLAAVERKASAIIIVHDEERLPDFEGDDVTRDAGIPALAVLGGKARSPLGLEPRPDGPEKPAAAPPAEKTVRIHAEVSFERRTARNVLGWLTARGPGAVDELVILGAHHDGLGRGGASSMHKERRGEIHNGADDNASGVAGVIELAHRLKDRAGTLHRSVLFITFAAEERGLLGSKWFAEHPVLRMPGRPPASAAEAAGERGPLRPVAFVNMDMVGRLREAKLMESGLATSSGWAAVLDGAEKRAREDGVPPLRISPDKTEDLFGSSDHVSFYSILKIPVLFFFTGNHKEYHSPDDDLYRRGPDGKPEPLINLPGECQVLGHVEEVLIELALSSSPLPYEDKVELAPRMALKAVLRLMPDYGADVEGMRIADVTAGGPAERAGLRSGDVVVRFGTTPVRSVRDYMVGLEKAAPGQEVEIEVLRAGKRLTAMVSPISLPGGR
jgi:peptidase M28-like protein/PDZ domain-containing protein